MNWEPEGEPSQRQLDWGARAAWSSMKRNNTLHCRGHPSRNDKEVEAAGLASAAGEGRRVRRHYRPVEHLSPLDQSRRVWGHVEASC
eukprot:2637200-Pyramimonas_sp.AAC.1